VVSRPLGAFTRINATYIPRARFMHDKDIILIGQAINGLSDARDILHVLVDKGVLPASWREIEAVLDMIHSDLCDLEIHFASQTRSWPIGAS
jgi:hypothetical protein